MCVSIKTRMTIKICMYVERKEPKRPNQKQRRQNENKKKQNLQKKKIYIRS